MMPALRAAAALSLLAATAGAQTVLQTPEGLDVGFDWPTQRAAADLDGNGTQDLIISCNTFPSRLLTRLNMPSGDLVPGPLFESGPGYYFIQPAFIDGDTDVDFVSFVGGLPVTGETLCFRRGLGNGDFDPPVGLPEDDALNDMALGDLDADGELDFVTTGITSSFLGYAGGLEVWRGDGQGGFTKTHHHDPGEGGLTLDVGDIDQDGLLDVVMGAADPAQFPSVPDQLHYRHLANGIFAPPVLLAHKGTEVGLVDLDLDGWLDLFSIPTTNDRLDVQRGLPGGTFAAPQALPLTQRLTGYAVGDLDGDGLPDIVAQLETDELEVLRNEGGLQVGSDLILSKSDGHYLPTLVDLDGDGLPEVISAPIDDSQELLIARNATYGPGEAFADLGHALPGSEGWPVLVAEGSLANASPFAFRVGNGLPGATAVLVVGASRIDAPFKGGALVPFPDLLLGFVPLASDGSLELAGTWPVIPVGGFDLWFHAWFQDPGAVQGWAATSAVVGHVP